MNPIFQEETIQKLNRYISESDPEFEALKLVPPLVDDIEVALKAYKDNDENRILLYSASGLVILFSMTLVFIAKVTWPLMFLVIWAGAYLYFRVHERGLIIQNIQMNSLITPYSILPKIEYLKSAIDLKLGRKEMLTYILAIFFSSAVMMAHYLFVDSSFWMNIGLLSLAIVASFLFWQSFYKQDVLMLNAVKDQLQALKFKFILDQESIDEEE